jgi:hypothetical protein
MLIIFGLFIQQHTNPGNKYSSALVLNQSWSVYMEKLLPLQLQTMVHFGFVGKNQAVSSFAKTKIVICIREL